jgi:SAM-dependent methyltransferase
MSSLLWKIDECSVYFERLRLRGWCFNPAPGAAIQNVAAVFPALGAPVVLRSFGLPSVDVAHALGRGAEQCRFDEFLELPDAVLGRDFTLLFTLADGSEIASASAQTNANDGDPFHACWAHFVESLHRLPPGDVLEIGSRARSAITRREVVPPHLGYVGLDILPGPNVDVVGDAHQLERLFGRSRFVAAFSFSVFEHLAMPWRVAIELNRVLRPGGIVFTQTHQTWPVHEEPWDFWRFSRHSWQTLFNEATGFEVVEAAHGEPARIHACRANPITRQLAGEPAYLGSDSIVRKISETSLTWPVALEVAAAAMYPKGELQTPPA